jgi:hypothetical protein
MGARALGHASAPPAIGERAGRDEEKRERDGTEGDERECGFHARGIGCAASLV